MLFSGPPYGIGMLTAGFILGVMVLPFIAAIMRDVFETVPPMLRESAYGLGATTAEVVWQVVLPYARAGVAGGILLGLGRPPLLFRLFRLFRQENIRHRSSSDRRSRAEGYAIITRM